MDDEKITQAVEETVDCWFDFRQSPPNSKLTISVEEASKLLGISRGLAYQAVRTGQIFTIRIGRRYLVPVAWLHKKLETADQPG